jgi:leader peptidase (prepilin peptidase)/N-methyltransferase
MTAWIVLTALLGAAASSLVQVVIDRTDAPLPQTRLRERSRCPGCSMPLSAWDTLPVFSFVLLRGRCRGCGSPIPARHLLGEIAGGVVWALSAAVVGVSWWLPAALVAPMVAVLLLAGGRHPRRSRLLVALLPLLGVALLTVGLGGALTGRWALYATAGLLGATALLAGVLLTGRDAADRRPQQVQH